MLFCLEFVNFFTICLVPKHVGRTRVNTIKKKTIKTLNKPDKETILNREWANGAGFYLFLNLFWEVDIISARKEESEDGNPPEQND